MTPQSEHNILISPLGNVDKELTEPLIKEIERVFGFKTVVTSLLNDVNFALDPAREQYHSTLILAKLENIAPPGTLKLVAITDVDLFIPILTYVFGEAQLGGTSCVVSTHRLAEGISPISLPEAFHYRVIKEAVHELGHILYLDSQGKDWNLFQSSSGFVVHTDNYLTDRQYRNFGWSGFAFQAGIGTILTSFESTKHSDFTKGLVSMNAVELWTYEHRNHDGGDDFALIERGNGDKIVNFGTLAVISHNNRASISNQSTILSALLDDKGENGL